MICSFRIGTFMPLAGMGCVVSKLLQQFWKVSKMCWQRRVQFGSACVMRIPSGDDTASAWTTGTRCNEYIRKPDSLFRHPIEIGCADNAVAITSDVIPTNVVGDNKNNVRVLLRPRKMKDE